MEGYGELTALFLSRKMQKYSRENQNLSAILFHGFYMYEDRLLQVQEWWLSDRLYILKDRPAVFGNPDYQMNSSSVQKQLKAAGIDTNSKKYKAVLSEMMKNGNGAMFTNVQAIKNLMSQYDKNGGWIDPNTGLTGLAVTDENRNSYKHII